MPNYIKTTLTVSSNKASAASLPGPLSVALSLSGSDSLTVDNVESKIVSATLTPAQVFDGSGLSGGTWTPATIGGYIYLKNTGTAKNALIGLVSNVIENDGSTVLGNDAPEAPHASNAGHLADTADTTLRTLTLKPGEFAWFPWDYTGDIYVEADHSDGTTLEVWRFDRG